MTDELPRGGRTRHRRLPEHGRYDREEMRAILRAGFVCHLGVIVDGHPMVVPTVYGLDETADTMFLHGSVASRSLTTGAAEICVTVTHVDGLVLARSVFEHGVNYRAVMVYGVPRVLTDPEEKLAGLRRLSEHTVPGQWAYVRLPNRKELAATTILELPLAEASVKIRCGPPDDGDGPDRELPVWAGVLPLTATWGEPVPDPALPDDRPVPAHIASRAGHRLG